MTKGVPTQERKHLFTVELEIDDHPGFKGEPESVSLNCELTVRDETIEGPPDYYPDNRVSREKIQLRVNYIFQHLSDAVIKLWNESKLASEFDAGDIKDGSELRDILARWRTADDQLDSEGRALVSRDAESRLPGMRGRPPELDRKTSNEMDLIAAEELTKFQNARKEFEAHRENPQLGDWREPLLRILGSDRFALAETGFTSLDPYESQPSTITYKYLAKLYGLSERQLQRVISRARKRRTALNPK